MSDTKPEKKVFIIDVSICNGCYCCQIACKDEHVGNDWLPYARSQPDTGQFWMKLNEYVRGTVPKVKMHYLPVLCMHCDNAPCISSCPPRAIYKRDDGLVIIEPEKCTGCKACVDSCPHNVIFFNEDLNLAQKCTGCAHLLEDGWEVPRCVDACPTEALKFGTESDLKELIEKATVLNPEQGLHQRVYYLNIPGKFIAGTVYDPVEKEVIIGAQCSLNYNGTTLSTTTDGFGDFWFEGLAEGDYNLTIEADGYITGNYDNINTQSDVNLGDIPLNRINR